MKKKKILQILFFVLLAAGITLTQFGDTRPFGFLFLCVIQSIIALYYISIFKQTETEENKDLALRYPLLISLQVTFIFLIINYLFRIMNWPFFGPVTVLLFILVIATVLLSIGFVVVNREIIQSIFVVELVMMTLPIILFLGTYTSNNYSKTEYSEALHKQYQDLNQIENILYLSAKQDTLFDFTTVDFISKEKKSAIDMSGGIDVEKGGIIVGGLHKFHVEEIELDFKRKNRESLVDEIRRLNPKTTIEYLNALTKLQIDVLLKERK